MISILLLYIYIEVMNIIPSHIRYTCFQFSFKYIYYFLLLTSKPLSYLQILIPIIKVIYVFSISFKYYFLLLNLYPIYRSLLLFFHLFKSFHPTLFRFCLLKLTAPFTISIVWFNNNFRRYI